MASSWLPARIGRRVSHSAAAIATGPEMHTTSTPTMTESTSLWTWSRGLRREQQAGIEVSDPLIDDHSHSGTAAIPVLGAKNPRTERDHPH